MIAAVCFHSKLAPRVTGFAPYLTSARPDRHLSLTLRSMPGFFFLLFFSDTSLFAFFLSLSLPSHPFLPCFPSLSLGSTPLFGPPQNPLVSFPSHMSRRAHVHACTHSLNQRERLHIGLDSCYKKSHPLNTAVLSLHRYRPTAGRRLSDFCLHLSFGFQLFLSLSLLSCVRFSENGMEGKCETECE